MKCPLCRNSSSFSFVAHGYEIRDCSSCDHRFAGIEVAAEHTHEIYGDDYFQGGGAGYPDYLAEGRILRAHGRWYGRRIAQYLRPGKMLDVGSAAGFILQGFTDCGWQGIGIEPNRAMAEHAQKKLGLDVRVGTCESMDCEHGFDDQSFDLISMIQVVAHFVDVSTSLKNIARVTKPSGYWLVESWNRASIAARVFGQRWHEYSPPSVLHWFSPRTFRDLASRYGFREIATGRPAKWINGGHAKSLLQYKLNSSAAGRMAGRLLNVLPDYMPIPYLADDLFWMLLQKS